MDPLILVIGSANTDLVVRTPRFPTPGETLLGGEFFMFPGGKGANQAVAAARLGGRVALVCKLGRDLFGKRALKGYNREGIDTENILFEEGMASGTALITVNEQGQNCIVVAPGANASLLPADLDGITSLFDEAELIVLQLEVPLLTVEHAIRLARTRGKRVILNPAPAQALPNSLYEGLYLITPNETEAEVLTGLPVASEHQALTAALVLRGHGVQNVIITLGERGAFLLTETFTGLVAATPVRAVDTTAAGDVFNGALAAALTSLEDWQDAARFACHAAGVSVTRMGAQASAPYLHELPTRTQSVASPRPHA